MSEVLAEMDGKKQGSARPIPESQQTDELYPILKLMNNDVIRS